jgi:hypothetical protein
VKADGRASFAPAMSATEIVAVVGAISTPVVALAGYGFNERRSRDDRAATRELAQDSHEHEGLLAEAQREHEAELRRNERLYTDRKETYVELLKVAAIAMERVRLTEPIITTASMPKMPDPPSDERWEDMQARVGWRSAARPLAVALPIAPRPRSEASRADHDADASERLVVCATLSEDELEACLPPRTRRSRARTPPENGRTKRDRSETGPFLELAAEPPARCLICGGSR